MRVTIFTILALFVGLTTNIRASENNEEGFFLNDDYDVSSGDANISDIETTTTTIKSCPKSTRKNTDDFVDKVLNNVRPKLPAPAYLPERSGRFKLFNGTLENLNTLQRVGPAMVRCTDSDFSFLVPIGLQNLTGKYFWEFNTALPVFRGFIDMYVGKVEAEVLYTRERIDLENLLLNDAPQKALIEKLKIRKLENVRVNFDGLGPMSKLASKLTNMITKYFSKAVSRIVEGPVMKAINKELQNVEKYEKYFL